MLVAMALLLLMVLVLVVVPAGISNDYDIHGEYAPPARTRNHYRGDYASEEETLVVEVTSVPVDPACQPFCRQPACVSS